MAGSRARFKARLAEAAPPDAATLPVREAVLDRVRTARDAGRPVILATAADRRVADAVAARLGPFDAVLASDGTVNLRGEAKLRAVREAAGPAGFEYLGDAEADLPVWAAARHAVLVGDSPALAARVRTAAPEMESIPVPRSGLRAVAEALRIHQGSKNLLLFVPLLLAHRVADAAAWQAALTAFLSFGLCSSGLYVINDLLDLPSDRRHPRKRRRPFASGVLSIPSGLALALGALAAGGALAAVALPPRFGAVLGIYSALALLYSVRLARIPAADVILLASFYTLRVLGGGAATGIPVSPWLLAFSLFFFLNLALLKRYAEIRAVEPDAGPETPVRAYRVADAEMLRAFGPGCALLSVLVLALYIQGREVVDLYREPALLWLVGPLLVHWLTRFWLQAHRGRVADDPVLHVMKDPVSYAIGALIAVVVALAATGGPWTS
jgi:4-hydroxybenzoate polyprenyltransferase